MNNTAAGEQTLDPSAGAVDALQQAPDGSIYFMDIYPSGVLYHIYYSLDVQPPSALASADKTNGDLPLTVNFSETGSTDPQGLNLNYKWDFGDGSTSTDQNPAHTYTTKGQYVAKLVVNNGTVDSTASSVNIAAGYMPPSVTITSPVENTHYNAGDKITYSATATDPQDGSLPASAYSWTVRMHHLTHFHPFLGPITGVTSGSFTVPNNVENSPDVSYDITLTVTDSANLSTSVTRTIYPNLVTFTVNSTPVQNMVVDVDGIPFATSYVQKTTVGYKIVLRAETPITRDGVTYQFVNWSDNATANEHTVTIPTSDVTYTANYQATSTPTPTPSPTPSPGPSAYQIGAGQTVHVPQYTVIGGDVKAGNVPLYDSDPKTGLVVLFENEADVTADWGAFAQNATDQNTAETNMQQMVQTLLQHGCGGSCTSVNQIHWTSNTQTAYQLAPGQTMHLPQYTTVLGDVKINGQPMYDDVASTGLVTTLNQAADVTAPWGATAITNGDAAFAQTMANNMASEVQKYGCGNGCAHVDVLKWPDNKQQGT